jgi:hypothetical protein
MLQQNSIELHLKGYGMSPGLLRSKDLAQLIEAIEEMIAAKVAADHPELRKEQIIVGLSEIASGSVTLQFASSSQALTAPALKEIAHALETNNFYSLPEDSVKSLKTISKFSQTQHCTAEIYELNGSRKLLATITPKTAIVDCEPIRGETTIYGIVTRVGGANEDTPTIQMRTIEGKLIYCTANQSNAKLAAQRLYQQIGLHGIAEWNVRTYEMMSFQVTAIADYERTSLSEAVDFLSQNYGEQFDTITDVDGFVRELRNGV